jgi:hypothetical protein
MMEVKTLEWVVGATCFAIAAASSYVGFLPDVNVVIARRTLGQADGYVAGGARATGRELVMVFIGDSTCRWSTDPATIDAVRRLKVTLRDQAVGRGMSFAAVAVSGDRSTEAGAAFLHGLGAFDEIIVGDRAANSGWLRYVWRDLPGFSSTPQVVVTERVVEPAGGGGEYNWRMVDQERLMARKIGAGEIRTWLERGAPLRD